MARSWGLMRFERHTLLIPDHPVTLIRDKASRPGPASALNERFAWNARKELFHHPDDNPLNGVELPPVRDRETQVSQPPENFLLPDGPSDAFKRVLSSV